MIAAGLLDPPRSSHRFAIDDAAESVRAGQWRRAIAGDLITYPVARGNRTSVPPPTRPRRDPCAADRRRGRAALASSAPATTLRRADPGVQGDGGRA